MLGEPGSEGGDGCGELRGTELGTRVGGEVRSGPLGCRHRPSVLGVLHPTAGGRSRRRLLR